MENTQNCLSLNAGKRRIQKRARRDVSSALCLLWQGYVYSIETPPPPARCAQQNAPLIPQIYNVNFSSNVFMRV